MCLVRRSPMLQTLLSPFRRPQQETLALVIAAIIERTQAGSMAVAGHLAVELDTQLGSALTRFYRLSRNPRIDDQLLTAQLLALLRQERPLLVASDWGQSGITTCGCWSPRWWSGARRSPSRRQPSPKPTSPARRTCARPPFCSC